MATCSHLVSVPEENPPEVSVCKRVGFVYIQNLNERTPETKQSDEQTKENEVNRE